MDDGEVKQKKYLSLTLPESRVLYLSAPNHGNYILQLVRQSIIDQKNVQNSSSPQDFWHLSQNTSNNFISSYFLPLFYSDNFTATTPVSKAELFS